MGFRAIERVTGISHNTILNWVRVAETHIDEENYEIPEIAQIDELQTFVGSKKTIWVWTVVNTKLPGILKFVIGDRLWSKEKSPSPTPLQNRACEFPSTRLLM
ncbi:hypothetical protein AmaxDRAFT_3967 [Limnospira maxima CS-328]|uniref:IS1 transposase n=1 Tax=Limnospira maxima CS-328 TaxID=513049 RepID=B5W5C2_LIMMA|nr:hypothetical protein AmaxDRAFT_3967 [Limnospira maxima CS-328]UWU49111.1 hypothetical protein APLC1_3934 [Arthrospira platensis C1]